MCLGPKAWLARPAALGRALGEFRRVSIDFQLTLNYEAAKEEARETAEKKREEAAKSDEKPAETVTQTGATENPGLDRK